MAGPTSNIELYTRLNTELMSMVEQFTNLIKGTKEGKRHSMLLTVVSTPIP
jgi:hypothetical protein